MTSRALALAYSATGDAWRDGPARVYDRLAEALVARSPVDLAGRTVLDLGAGTGAATRAIRSAGGVPIAADVAIGMLRAIDSPVPPRAVADARHLPLADHSLDGVVAAFSLNHLPDPHRALREAIRVMRPGSPLLVSAYESTDDHPVKGAVDAAATELGWRAAAWVDHLRAESIPALASVRSARAAADAAGLCEAEVSHHEVSFPELTADDLVAWRCGMAQLAPFVAGLTPTQRRDLRTRALELLGDPPTLRRHVLVIAAVTR